MFKTIIISEIVSKGFDALKHFLKPKDISIVVSKMDLEMSLKDHYKYILNTTSTISFKDLKGNKKINQTYIDLEIELQPIKYKLKNQRRKKYKIDDIINKAKEHLIILGGPGAGKTTTVKKVCQSLLFEDNINNYNFPILINLRDLKKEQTIYQRLKDILGIQIVLNNKKVDSKTILEDQELRVKYVNSYLDNLKAIIILDGLDEVNPSKLSSLNQEIKSLIHNLTNSLIIVTCRSASYNISIDNSLEYELCNLNKRQIKEFVNKWFVDKSSSEIFLSELEESKFYDFSLKPISLAHLCAIYERTKKFYDKPKSIYKKLVHLLIEEWDEQREIIRESEYANFDNDRKFDFLSHIAFDLTIRFDRKLYLEADLKDSFHNINEYFNLPKKQCVKVVKEIEAHTGILIQSRYETYEFVHKSMQEYLAAEHIVKMPEIPIKLLHNVNISNELAIAVALSSDPNTYFFKLIFDIFNHKNFDNIFILEFLSRLAYEKPDFRETLLLPYSFAYIIGQLLEYNKENNEKISNIIKQFKSISNVKFSFKRFLLSINSYSVNAEDFMDEEIEIIKGRKLEEDSYYLDKISSVSDLDNIEELEIENYINIELEESFFNNLNDNERAYIGSDNELKIPKYIYEKHFK